MYTKYVKKLTVPKGCVHKLLLIMRLTTVILIASLIQVSAATFGQTVTLKRTNVPLKVVFSEIRKQTGFIVLYPSEEVNNTKLVDINLDNVAIADAMNKILDGQDLEFSIKDKAIVIREKAPSFLDRLMDRFAVITVHGVVTDAEGKILSGATVKIKGTSKATKTNSNGAFYLANVDENAVLVISFLGYEDKEVKVAREVGTISLTISTGKLEEVTVVSTGYQTISKERATGSFTVVNNELYNEQVSPDVLSRLEYITNGLSVFRNNGTRTSQLMVRGISTINGPTSPLIILDNFPYDGDINNLNPNSIESVSVLKDAAAASIWGTKAGNGVIVITTKKGKYNQPLNIDINSNLTFGSKPDLDYLTPMLSSDYVDFERFLYGKGYYTNQINSSQYSVLSPVVQLLVKAAKGALDPTLADAQINALKGLDVRDDYSKYIYRNALNQQYHIDLKGGSDNVAYLFSTGYDKNISNLSANFNKLNLRSEVSFKPVKNLQVTTGLAYTSSDQKTGKLSYGSINPLQPYQMLADNNGNALVVAQTYSQAFKDNAALNGKLLDWNYYPLTDSEHNYTTTNTQDLLGNFSAQYQIFKGLNFDVKYQYERQQLTANTLYDAQSYFARNLVNSHTQINGTTVKNIIPKGGVFDQRIGAMISNSVRGQLNFSRDWGKHSLTLLAGEELRSVENNSNTSRLYGYNEDILTSATTDYLTSYPNYATKASAFVPYQNNFSKTLNRFVSFYANGAYVFNSKYTISGSIRRDASNLFGVKTNDKWTPLWSSGISWNLSNEDFYPIAAIPYLKLRATYGYSGNVDPSKSAVTTITYQSANSAYTNSPISTVSNFYNPDLRWEKIRTINFGLDFKIRNNRVYGSIGYYLKNAKDLYATVPVDYTVGLGVATITKNVAEMKGRGLDIELNSINIDNAVKWITNLNLNYYKDKVSKYYLTSSNGNNYVGNFKSPVEGHPVWSVYSYQWKGLDNLGNPQGVLGGQISENYTSLTGSGTQVSDLVYSGPRFPVVYGSLGNTISYKGLSLTARMSFGFGNYFRRQSVNYSSLASGSETNIDYSKRWQNSGDENITSVPSSIYPLVSARDNFYTGSEVLIEKADCIRLQYVTLSYNIVQAQYLWLPFKVVQFYLNANNLGIIWRANKLGIDPDYTYTNTVFPATKNIAIGLKANF